MRTALLLLLSVAITAADLEVITLKDGRCLTGTYENGRLSLEGGVVVLTVAEADIANRVPAPPPVVVSSPVTAPAAGPVTPAKAKPSARDTYLAAQAEAKRLRDQARAVEAAFVVEFLRHGDFAPVPVPTVGNDPRPSEKAAAEHARDLNSHLQGLREYAKQVAESDTVSDAILKNVRFYFDAGRFDSVREARAKTPHQ
jgi:hypothetical protein